MKWIKMNDQLPAPDQLIMLWNGIDIEFGSLDEPEHINYIKTKPYLFIEINGYFYPIEEFTHWMPLPGGPID